MGRYHGACVLVSLIFSSCIYARQPLLIVDTYGKQQYAYRNLIALADTIGFDVTYCTIYDLMQKTAFPPHQTVLLLINREFVEEQHSPLGQPIIHSLQSLISQSSAVMLALPPINQTPLTTLLDTLAIRMPDNQARIDTAVHTLVTINPPCTYPFNTALLTQAASQCSPEQPQYVIVSDPQRTYFFTPYVHLTFSEIQENFLYTPAMLEERTPLLLNTARTLQDFYNHVTNIQQLPLTQLPPFMQPDHILKEKTTYEATRMKQLSKRYAWIKDGISCAWLSPADFFLHEDKAHQQLRTRDPQQAALEEQKALQRGIAFLDQAKFNVLWIELSPEWYLSKNAMLRNGKEVWIARITTVLRALKQHFQSTHKPLPRLFIGMNITGNFRALSAPDATYDLFGKQYNAIPACLDYTHLWQTEVLDTFDACYALFNHEYPIAGIFLDFEMYHAPQQASQYTDLMDFSESAWRVYRVRKKTVPYLHTVSERVQYLSNHKLFPDYFNTLAQEAVVIGKKISQHIHRKNSDLLIGAYAPTIAPSWFYQGMFSGLSTPKKPLLLATFNTDFFSHVSWLMQKNIYALHGGPIMLSKFQHADNFRSIPALKKYHTFIWYNRPSRMVYGYTGQQLDSAWWHLEASPLAPDTVAQGIATYGRNK